MKNKIKIIVPFYNPGKFLNRCVNSLLTQDYDNYEILFIDDCSSDDSFSKIPAVKYKGDENGQLLNYFLSTTSPTSSKILSLIEQ